MTKEIKKKKVHTISMLVANKPGVLSRIALVFARRGFNIDALVVSPSFDPRYSRMTITAQGDLFTLDQIIKQTSKLVDVINSEEHTDKDAIHKELALFKLRSTPANKSLVQSYKKKFNVSIVNENSQTIIIEQIGTTDQLDELESHLKKLGIFEMVRSGKLVMAIGKGQT